MSEDFKQFGLEVVGETKDVIAIHKDDDLAKVAQKQKAIGLLSLNTVEKDVDLTTLSYESMQEKFDSEKVYSNHAPTSDYTKVGDKIINVALQKTAMNNITKLSIPCSKTAAHLSVNVQRSADGKQFSVVDKDLIRNYGKIFSHESSEVMGRAIVQKVPEGQMEVTTIVSDDEHSGLETLYQKAEELANIMSVISADKVKADSEEQLKSLLLNLSYILNKGSMRTMIDNKVLAALKPDEQKQSTKADRYEEVTNIMAVVNDKLGTFAMSSHVATVELVDWTYSVFEPETAKSSKAKGRKYFMLSSGLGLKVDMKGAQIGGRYPIDYKDIETFKKNAGKLQALFLTVMENQIREELSLPIFQLPECNYEKSDILEGKETEQIINYILKKHKSKMSASTILAESRANMIKAVDDSFDYITTQRAINLDV